MLLVKSFNGSQDHYRYAKYKSNTGSCTAHFIREKVLKQIVWSRIFDVTALFFDDIIAFKEMMCQQCSAETEKETKRRKQEVNTYEQNKSDFDSFSAIIRKYVGIKELTSAIVNEFIKEIIVHAPEKVDGKRGQKVDIVFNFVRGINFLSATQFKRQGA